MRTTEIRKWHVEIKPLVWGALNFLKILSGALENFKRARRNFESRHKISKRVLGRSGGVLKYRGRANFPIFSFKIFSWNFTKIQNFRFWVENFDEILFEFLEIFDSRSERGACSHRPWRKNPKIRRYRREMSLRNLHFFWAPFLKKNHWNLGET